MLTWMVSVLVEVWEGRGTRQGRSRWSDQSDLGRTFFGKGGRVHLISYRVKVGKKSYLPLLVKCR